MVADDPEDRKGRLKKIGGSQSDHWNNTLVNQAMQALWMKNSSPEERDKQLSATVAALIGIGPKDELEGMMAAQLIAAHNAAMECYRRAMIGEQTFEGRAREPRPSQQAVAHLCGAWSRPSTAIAAKGQQKVTVEHVHVHAGGQAVVGVVGSGGRGSQRKSKATSCASPYLCTCRADVERKPGAGARAVAGDAERQVPHARGRLTRSTKR